MDTEEYDDVLKQLESEVEDLEEKVESLEIDILVHKEEVEDLTDELFLIESYLEPVKNHSHYDEKLKEIIETQSQRGNIIELVNYLEEKYG